MGGRWEAGFSCGFGMVGLGRGLMASVLSGLFLRWYLILGFCSSLADRKRLGSVCLHFSRSNLRLHRS